MSARRLFGERSQRGQAAAIVGVAIGAALLGYTAGSLGRQVLATQLARAERGNLELRENNTALEAALRNARVPLQRRIHELEQALAGPLGGPGRTLAADPATPAPTEVAEAEPVQAPEPELLAVAGAAAAALAAPAAEPRDAQARAEELETARQEADLARTRLEGELESLQRNLTDEEGVRADLEAENRRLAKRITALELANAEPTERPRAAESAAVATPAVAEAVPTRVVREPLPTPANLAPVGLAAPAAPEPDLPASKPATGAVPAGSCAALEQAEFRLEAAGDAVRRLDGRLVMRLARTGDGLALQLGAGERYPLEDSPQHVSFDCAGTPYIVSVCHVEEGASEASGTIWLADTWRNPCR